MAERLVSPGVATKELDLTFLPQGIAEIGAAFVGPFLKGPAFRPVIVESQEELVRTFGTTTPDFYTPHAAQSYLGEASRATIVRVLGLFGYDDSTRQSLILRISGSGAPANGAVIGIIHPSRLGVTLASGSVIGTTNNFSLTLSGSNGSKSYSNLTVDPTSKNYFAKVLGQEATTIQDGYVYAQFPSANNLISGSVAGSGSLTLAPAAGAMMLSGSAFGSYRNASTPMIRSQLLGSIKYDLFQVLTIGDGVAANSDVKISITNIRPAVTAGEYGTFSLLVRRFDDTDSRLNILEQFDNLNLDSTSPNFVAAKIGNSRTILDANGDIYLEGEWPNTSKYIYIDTADGIEVVPPEALPYGFAPLAPPVNSTGVPAPAYVTSRYTTPVGSSISLANSKTFYGFNFADATGQAYLNPLPSGSNTKVGVGDTGFDLLTSLSGSDALDIAPITATSIRKFSVPFQGGFDGLNPGRIMNTGNLITATNTMGFDLSDSTKPGAKAYVQAIAALANPDYLDINLLVTPGVVYSQHPYVIGAGIDMVESRGDAFYVFDGDVLGATVDSVVNAVAGLDTNYAAVYHPWVKIRDNASNKTIWAPPSVVMPAVFAFSDRVGAEWYAPAGLNRGGIGEALQVRSRLDQAARNNLYEGRVNPIASFPNQGIVAWGQKTLQHLDSAFNRINVRRLLIAVRKFIASTSRFLVFEQNVEATRNRFLGIVNPYLASVQERNGLYAFKVIMDSSNNTADLIDREILYGQLYLQPTRSAEAIFLDFNVLPTGAIFPE